MIKQSNLLKWAQNNKNGSRANKTWIHPPEALQQGHVAYLVKFLGNIEVDQAKGIDVIKEGIRKLKFNQQLKKSEGAKTPKVEVTISVDGVAIQDPKTKHIAHQYPLHRISYCANDKSDKKFFSFIAKEENNEKHMCFVFASDRLAEDITLTIGEAFDLAYRRFLETSGKDLENKKQLMLLQKKVQDLETENSLLKRKICELSSKKNDQLNGMGFPVNVTSAEHQKMVKPDSSSNVMPRTLNNNIPQPPPSQELFSLVSLMPAVGTRLENLAMDDLEDFNPRDNALTNGNVPKNGAVTDVFGATPFNPLPSQDPFGMGDFNNMPVNSVDLESAIGELDKRLSEMRDGFSRGITFGKEDFFNETVERELHENKGQ